MCILFCSCVSEWTRNSFQRCTMGAAGSYGKRIRKSTSWKPKRASHAGHWALVLCRWGALLDRKSEEFVFIVPARIQKVNCQRQPVRLSPVCIQSTMAKIYNTPFPKREWRTLNLRDLISKWDWILRFASDTFESVGSCSLSRATAPVRPYWIRLCRRDQT